MDTKTFMTLTFTLIYLINYLDNLADDIPWILSKMNNSSINSIF